MNAILESFSRMIHWRERRETIRLQIDLAMEQARNATA